MEVKSDGNKKMKNQLFGKLYVKNLT